MSRKTYNTLYQAMHRMAQRYELDVNSLDKEVCILLLREHQLQAYNMMKDYIEIIKLAKANGKTRKEMLDFLRGEELIVTSSEEVVNSVEDDEWVE